MVCGDKKWAHLLKIWLSWSTKETSLWHRSVAISSSPSGIFLRDRGNSPIDLLRWLKPKKWLANQLRPKNSWSGMSQRQTWSIYRVVDTDTTTSEIGTVVLFQRSWTQCRLQSICKLTEPLERGTLTPDNSLRLGTSASVNITLPAKTDVGSCRGCF